MNVVEEILILIVISPLIYLGFRFLCHLERIRTEAWNEAIKKAAEAEE